MTWSEDRLHVWLARRTPPRGLAGSRMHDASVLARMTGRPVVCVDQCIEGVHFTKRTRAALAGRKAVARALSDLAATAARPRALLLSVCAPRERSETWIKSAISGARDLARSFGADLVGGDLAAHPGAVVLSATAIGEHEGSLAPPGRDRAEPGQIVVLTGAVGGSLLGRHLRIEPRIDAGIWLAARGATAMMDVSDGLAWDLHRLARASGVRIDLDIARIPVHRDARRIARRTKRAALDHALCDGEDHELVATLPESAIDRVMRESRAHGSSLCLIGRVTRGRDVWLAGLDAVPRRWNPKSGGFKHGS